MNRRSLSYGKYLLYFYIGFTFLVYAEKEIADLTTKSLPYRSALHQNPELKVPFDALWKLYQDSDQGSTLEEIYRSHLNQYPHDQNGRMVWLRILISLKDRRAVPETLTFAKNQPHLPFAQYLVYKAQKIDSNYDLNALNLAIQNEPKGRRKNEWRKEFLKSALKVNKIDQISKQIHQMASLQDENEFILDYAKALLRHPLTSEALTLLQPLLNDSTDPDIKVESHLLAAQAYMLKQQKKQAIQLLDHLLQQVTHQYWRRPEILQRRLALLKTDQERTTFLNHLKSLVTEDPNNGNKVLDYLRALDHLGQKEQCLEVIKKWKAFEHYDLERFTLKFLEREKKIKPLLNYLSGALQKSPNRSDLTSRRMEFLGLQNQIEGMLDDMNHLKQLLEEKDYFKQCLDSARLLRSWQAHEASMILFDQVLKGWPDRFDLRREAAELALLRDDRKKLKDIIYSMPEQEVLTNDLLDFVRLMIKEGQLQIADQILEKRNKVEEDDLSLQLLRLEMARLKSNPQGASIIIKTSRKYADTPARYQLYLDQARSTAEELNFEQNFLKEERQSLLQSKPLSWSNVSIYIRFLNEHHHRELAQVFLSECLKLAPVDEKERLQQLKISITDWKNATENDLNQLNDLIQQNPNQSDLYHAYLGLHYHNQRLMDPIPDRLLQINPMHIKEIKVLNQLSKAYRYLGYSHHLKKTLKQTLKLNRKNPQYWKDWIEFLAISGSEIELQKALQSLFMETLDQPLNEAALHEIKAHYQHSLFRATLLALQYQNPLDLQELTETLTKVSPLDTKKDQQWKTFLIAQCLAINGQTQKAIHSLEPLLSSSSIQQSTSPSATSGNHHWIAFPGGLSMNRSHLSQSFQSMKTKVQPTQTPPFFTNLDLRWILTPQQGEHFIESYSLNPEHLLLLGSSGDLTAIHLNTGKRIWQRQVRLALSKERKKFFKQYRIQNQLTRRLVTSSGDGSVAYIDHQTVHCINDRGELLWQWSTGSSYPTAIAHWQNYILLFLNQPDQVIFLNKQNGKRIQPSLNLNQNTQKVSFILPTLLVQNDQLLIHNGNLYLYDLKELKMIWKLNTQQSASFPLTLGQNSQKNPLASLIPQSRSRQLYRNNILSVPYNIPTSYSSSQQYWQKSLNTPWRYSHSLNHIHQSYPLKHLSWFDSWIVLHHSGKARLYSQHFPMIGVQFHLPYPHECLGAYRHRLYTAYHTQIFEYDPTHQQSAKSIDLNSTTGYSIWKGIGLSNQRLLASGPKGIAGYTLPGLKLAFRHKWPEPLQNSKDPQAKRKKKITFKNQIYNSYLLTLAPLGQLACFKDAQSY